MGYIESSEAEISTTATVIDRQSNTRKQARKQARKRKPENQQHGERREPRVTASGTRDQEINEQTGTGLLADM